MNSAHLYAIIPTGKRMSFPVRGMNGGRDRVHTVPQGEIAAVVSASPVADYQGLTRERIIRYLLVHQRVIETVMHDFPVLPVKFGTTLSEAAGVPRLLARGESLFRAALEQIADQQQVEVVAFWNTAEVIKEISQDGDIRQLKDELCAHATEISDAERIALGQMVQAAMERRRNGLRDRILAAVREVAVDTITNALLDDSMVANLAVLAREKDLDALNQRLRALDEEFAGRLRFRFVGPLPPYSFACVQVWAPTFEAINAARRLLGLKERAFPDEIKGAYRRLAWQRHPDLHPHDPGAESRMTALSQAHDLLTRYASSQTPAPGDRQPIPCRFDRSTVERTLAIAIQRQETQSD